MTTFLHPNGKTWRYDFRWKGRRYTGTTDQLTKEDADLVEAEVKKRLRQQAWGIAPVDRMRTPSFTDWASVFLRHQQARVTRADILAKTLRMVLAFWGRKPTKDAPVTGGAYHNLRLADPIIDAEWLEKFEEWMTARGISASTKNSYRSALSGMYRVAIRPAWRKKTNVSVNPCIGLERSATPSRQATITVAQLQAWIRESPQHVRLALAIAALAPKLRLASILGLRWDRHIDADLTYITNDQHKTIRTTGTPQVIPIDPQLRDILAPLRPAAKRARQPYVITFRGEPVKSIKTALSAAAGRAGIEYGVHAVTFHSLRHTMATILAELGVPEKQRQMVMGHLDLSTTQKYTHLRPTHEIEPIARLSAAVPVKGDVQGPLIPTVRKHSGKPNVSTDGKFVSETSKPQQPRRLRVVRDANS